MNSQRIVRVLLGLVAALAIATFLRFLFFDLAMFAGSADSAGATVFWNSLAVVLKCGLPLALLAAALTEYLRARRLVAYLGLGAALAVLAGYFATRGEELTSSAFVGGPLVGLSILVTGLFSGAAYWALAGRSAGWRGESDERAEVMAAEAFRIASVNAPVEYCKECIAGWAVLGISLFALSGWVMIETSGLREWFVDETESYGKSVLKGAGYAWATFKVDGNRGVITGLAPDEVQKRAAFDSVREALGSVTGFPGVLARIENESVARVPTESVAQQLADAKRRESEAKVAEEAARIAAESARAAEAEAKNRAAEQVQAAEEMKRKLEEQAQAVQAAQAEAKTKVEEQAQAAQVEIKRKIEEQARAAELEIKRKLEEQAVVAEAEIKKRLEERTRAAEEDARRAAEEEARKVAAAAAASQAAQAAQASAQTARTSQATAQTSQTVQVAAVETDPGAAAKPAVTEDQGGDAAAAEPAPVPDGAGCTSQDLAIIESSRIHFELQQFSILQGYESELDRLAASARACAPRPIQVSGFADADADSLFNPSLALQRAESVRQGLIARGVPEGLVMATFGKSGLGHEGDAGNLQRALNRRTEFRLLEASEISRDATLGPDERAATCERELVDIMSHSIVHFPTASSRISDESLGLIRKLSGAIQKCGSVIVTVEGHTDKIGGVAYNQGLSEARANAVKEALMSSGVNPTRLASKGFAASRPYDPAETAEAYAMNRRIEFKVSGKFTSTTTAGP